MSQRKIIEKDFPMKKLSVLLLILLLALSACSTGNASPLQPAEAASSIPTTETVSSPVSLPVESASNAETPISGMAVITLEGNSIAVSGAGAVANGRTLTIAEAGRYTLSGTLNDGQIIVSASNQDVVELVLNGVGITSASSAPIYIKNAEKVTLVLADGSQNTVTDSDSYILEEPGSDEPNAAIFSQDDLTIKGSGALTVNANYRHGIFSKDDLKINGGTLTVNSLVDGLKGRDSITIKDGVITLNAGGDGMQSTNDAETDRGYINITGGTLNITAALDGIQAQTDLFVSGGNLTLVTGGGSVNNSQNGGGIWGGRGMEGNPNKPTESAKGLKADGNISISGGTINVNAADDAVHANNTLTVDGGSLLLSSGDDGMHADSTLMVNGGDIEITQAYEGIESAAITVNGGTIRVAASDDGFNAAGGADGSAVNGRPGQNGFAETGNYKLTINGGTVYVDAQGDGLDANGPLEITNGLVIVNGPTANNNGALDYTGSFNITGGFFVVVGSSGMAQAPSQSSTQYSVLYNFQSAQVAGTLVHIETADGREILTFAPSKTYQSVVFSSPDLQRGGQYAIYTGGSSTGSAVDGLRTGGSYSGGSQVESFTISSMTTQLGAQGGFGPGGNRPPRP